MVKFLKMLVFSLGFMLLPLVSQAATLYLDPAESQYGPGESFPVDIKMHTEKVCINAVEINLEFTVGYLQVVDFIFGDSIINLWVERPDINEIDNINKSGRIYMAGGTPGGYCGRIPGDPGESNTIARIIFKIPSLLVSDERKLETAEIKFLEVTKVFVNDGFGSRDQLFFKNANIKILNQPLGIDYDWREQIKNDKIPPEPFFIELHSNPNVYNGRYYIDFFTVDKQSGVDRYEVLEIRSKEGLIEKLIRRLLNFLRLKSSQLRWEKGEIPYLLKFQDLRSIIKVKAVDKAGNERISEFMPPLSEQIKAQAALKRYYVFFAFVVAGISLLILFPLAFFILLKKKKKFNNINNLKEENKNNEEEKFN